jgi:mycofactocin system glycosyltransferase
MNAGLPDGFTVRIADGVKIRGRGQILVGGTPTRVVRLSDKARALLHHGQLTITDQASRVLADHLLDANLAVPVLPEKAPDTGDVTVVIPVHNRTDEVAHLLDLLTPHLPCVVVDDASDDGPTLAHAVADLGATYVRLDHNVGPAGARNAGLTRVATDYVAFVDSDVTVHPSDLLRLRQHFADLHVALIAPRVRGCPSSERPRWFERYDAEASSLDLGNRSSLVRPGGPVSYVPSACMIARVAALGGGFDESMRVGEDVDLVWRLADRGWRIRYDADVDVKHRTPRTARSWLGRKLLYGTSAADLAKRHGQAVAPAVFTPSGALTALALLSQRRWSAPVAAMLSLHTAHRLNHNLRMSGSGPRLVVELTLRGLAATATQCSTLLLRHWWPATAAAALVSRRARLALLTAVTVDLVSDTTTRPGSLKPDELLARRLDDLAYGGGVWLGAIRARCSACLLPPLTPQQRRNAHATLPSSSARSASDHNPGDLRPRPQNFDL